MLKEIIKTEVVLSGTLCLHQTVFRYLYIYNLYYTFYRYFRFAPILNLSFCPFVQYPGTGCATPYSAHHLKGHDVTRGRSIPVCNTGTPEYR